MMVRVAIEKVAGIQEVDVNLGTRVAEVALTPGNTLSFAALRGAIVAAGYDVRSAEITAVGTIERSKGETYFHVSGTPMRPHLHDPYNALDPAAAHAPVRLLGTLSLDGRTLTVEKQE